MYWEINVSRETIRKMNYLYPSSYDVVVVGGGNAGIEAAAAAARMKVRTLLVTHSIDNLGQQSCNPSIGGIGKSHLVKEIDALDGLMAHITDKSGIQFRVLNASKGSAVRATRAQIDRRIYKYEMRKAVESFEYLDMIEEAVDGLVINGETVGGVVLRSGIEIPSKVVVISAGTFLNGKIFIGQTTYLAGRNGEPSSVKLGINLAELGLPKSRLKTGTPARLDGRTIDFSKCLKQLGDSEPVPVFSYLGNVDEHPRQIPCWITATNKGTHEIISHNLERSPLFSGAIEGIGPRYCPSIEDKIHRFSGKDSHHVFLEPEGLDTYEYYPNGISTSLPYDVQLKFIHSIAGLEQVHLIRPGYAIEYDFYDPTQLKNTLESKKFNNLFMAGQVNGTTGYEEAGAQGIFAGINAALRVKGREEFVLRRDQAYMGVMIDDLITKGVNEPYRMFTSRAEFRLSLREDNADQRLTEIGYKLGVVSEKRWRAFNEKIEQIDKEEERLRSTWINPGVLNRHCVEEMLGQDISKEALLSDLIRRPEMNYSKITQLLTTDDKPVLEPPYLSRERGDILDNRLKYSGYVERQQEEVRRNLERLATKIPADFNYDDVKGLSFEICQKLKNIRPQTVGQASNISGVTPAAISVLLVYLKRFENLSKKDDATRGK